MGIVERTEAAAEDSAIRFLLDGLGVPTIRDLHALVKDGREWRAAMEPILAELRAAGVPEDLLPGAEVTDAVNIP